jgi:ribokinase
MRNRIVAVGSLNADFVVTVPRFPAPGETVPGSGFAVFPGGKGANQAVAAARLGGEVWMAGQVGDDAHGRILTRSLASAGVDTTHVRVDPAEPTGVAVISIDATGQNQIVVVPGANGTFDAGALERSHELIAGASIVLLQLEIPLATVAAAARIAREGGAVVILDPAPARELPDGLLRSVDYVTPNETELATLTGAGTRFDPQEASLRARELIARGARSVVVKLGKMGALLAGHAGEHYWAPFPVDAVDTTAAGDAFNAAFAVALARGRTPVDAGTFATAAAACSVTRHGAQPSMPTAEEVERLLRGSR